VYKRRPEALDRKKIIWEIKRFIAFLSLFLTGFGPTPSDRAALEPIMTESERRKEMSTLTQIYRQLREEMELGGLAEEMASSSDVRQYGGRLRKDSQLLQNELFAFSRRHNIPIENSLADPKPQNQVEELQALEGPDFDLVFLSFAEDRHMKSIDWLERVFQEEDFHRDINELFGRVTPIVRQHHELAINLSN
jgi:predicted outer membrane protein